MVNHYFYSHILETQKQGGIEFIWIQKHQLVEIFSIGVDDSKLLYLHFECVEDIFEAI